MRLYLPLPAVPVLASDLLAVSDAARLKGCTPATIRNAVKAGRLTVHRIGHRVFVVRDDAFEAFEVEETGGRLHKRRGAENREAKP